VFLILACSAVACMSAFGRGDGVQFVDFWAGSKVCGLVLYHSAVCWLGFVSGFSDHAYGSHRLLSLSHSLTESVIIV